MIHLFLYHAQANHLPSDNSVALQDVTSMFTVLTVAGPKSRDLMQQLTNSNLEMHPFTYKYVNMGYASGVLVLAVTQTGEPGYSMYIPTEYALHLYDKASIQYNHPSSTVQAFFWKAQ